MDHRDSQFTSGLVSDQPGFLSTSSDAYRRIGHVATAPGARTSLFVPEFDLLLIAARDTASDPPAVWVFRVNAATDEFFQ